LNGASVAGEALTLNQTTLIAASGVSSWSGSIGINGVTTLSANAAVTIGGNVNLVGAPLPTGSLTLRGSNAGSLGGTINIGTYACSGVIANSAARNVSLTVGGGTLVLIGANTYAGATNVAAGALQIGNGGATGSIGGGSINVSGGASITFNRSSALTVSNTIAGAGNIIQAGSATLTLG